MSITTVEQMDALSVGSFVEVSSQSNGTQKWERVEGGWLLDGAVVDTSLFRGAIAQACVTTTTAPPPVPGALFWDGTYHWLVVGPGDVPSQVRCLVLRNGLYYTEGTYSVSSLQNRVVDLPVWYASAWSMAQRAEVHRTSALTHAERITVISNERDAIRAERDAALAGVTAERLRDRLLTDTPSDHHHQMHAVFDALGIGMPQTDVAVDVEGTASVIPDEALDYIIWGGGQTIEIQPYTWSSTIGVIVRGREMCHCRSVNTDMVRAALPEHLREGLNTETWKATTCSRHTDLDL